MATSDASVKIIPGTKLVVDGFRLPNKHQYDTFFLTHFHSDHYAGLTSKWKYGTIYCSQVTANLVRHRFGIETSMIRALEMDQTHVIQGVKITLIDANHCPGSCLLLFELGNGESYLHTGDFRYSPDMLKNEALKPYLAENAGKQLSAVYLDTTYCHPSHLFPRQADAVDTIARLVKRKRDESNTRVLFLIGTYLIGKERILERVASECNAKVLATHPKWQVLKLLQLPYFDQVFTTDMTKSDIHVVNMFDCGWKKLWELKRTFGNRYDEIVAIKPTGWSFGGDRPWEKKNDSKSGVNNTVEGGSELDDSQYNIPDNDDEDGENTLAQSTSTAYNVQVTRRGNLTVCQVPYSEHSAFYELKEFIERMRPKQILPTVFNNDTHRKEILHLLSDNFKFDWMSVNNTLTIPEDVFGDYNATRKKRQKSIAAKATLPNSSMSILRFFKNVFSSSASTTPDAVKKESTTESSTKKSKWERIEITQQSTSSAVGTVQQTTQETMTSKDIEVIDLDKEDLGMQSHILSTIDRQRQIETKRMPSTQRNEAPRRVCSAPTTPVSERKVNTSTKPSNSRGKRGRSLGSLTTDSKKQKHARRSSMSILSFMKQVTHNNTHDNDDKDDDNNVILLE